LITNAQRTSIDHNLIADNGYSGIMLANRSEVFIQDNIFFTNRQYGIYVNEDSKRSRIVYNDFYNNRVPFNMYAVINETNISIDPILNPGDYTFFNGKSQLKGMGKEGCDIGPMGEAALEKNDKKSAEAINAINKDSDGDGIPDIYVPRRPRISTAFRTRTAARIMTMTATASPIHLINVLIRQRILTGIWMMMGVLTAVNRLLIRPRRPRNPPLRHRHSRSPLPRRRTNRNQ
jgi:parallel beta-helix repeat protein